MGASMPLVGRHAERADLDAVLSRASGGRSAVVVLTGEAGVGKSRLLREAAAMARQQDVPCIQGAFTAAEQDLPLAALRRGLSASRSPFADVERVESLLRTSGGRDVRYQIVQRAIDVLMDMIEAAQPVLFLIEDAQWADPETLQVMRAVVRRTVDRGLAVVATARPAPRPVGLTRFLHLTEPAVTELHLGPLDGGDLAELARQILGGEPGPRLTAELARTGGNALLACEALGEAQRRGLVTLVDGVAEIAPGAVLHAPDLHAHVRIRVESMSPRARQVVMLLALSDLTAEQLARLLDTTVAGALAAIEEVTTDGMVVADDHHLALRHDLLREVVVDQIAPAVRAGLHASIHRLRAAEGAGMLHLAPHLVSSSAAGPQGDLDVIADAGRDLLHSAPRAAATLLRRAYEAGCASAGVDLVFALILLGDGPGARDVLEAVEKRVSAADQARLTLAMGQVDFLRGNYRSASRRFESAAEAMGPGPEGKLALAAGAIASLFIGQLQRAQDLAERGGTAHPSADEHAACGTALLVRGWIAALGGDVRRGLVLARAGHRLTSTRSAASADANVPDFFLAQTLLWAEQPAAAETAVARGLRRCEQLGMGWAQPSLHAIQAEAEIRAGRFDDAETSITAGLAFAEDLEVAHGMPWCLAEQALITIGRGGDADPVLRSAEDWVGRLGGQGADLVLWMRGLAHLTAGCHADAAQVLGFLWGRLDAAGLVLRQVHIASDLMRASIVADPGRAAAVEQWLGTVATRREWPRATATWTHARGLRAGVGVLMAQAAAQMAGLGDLLGAARMHADAATAMPGPEGVADRARAATIFEYAGAHAWLDSLGTVARSTANGAVDAWQGLTPAQERIIQLVGSGMSNQAIADRLSVSRRTVESHLYHSYAKLGIGSRIELGLEAARRVDDGWVPRG